MNADLKTLDFFATEEIPYMGAPRIFRRVLDMLGCNQFDVYKELQAAFVPPVTNFVFSYEGLLIASSSCRVSHWA